MNNFSRDNKAEAERKQRMQRLRDAKDGVDDDSPATKKVRTGSDSDTDEEAQMNEMMGFGGFGTTKGKEVADNKTSAARGLVAKHKARKYRQYMNRKGGFNRPLEQMK